MNIARVYDRFAVLAGSEGAELQRCRPLIEEACRYVLAHCTAREPDSEQTRRLELLAAAYALRLCSLFDDGGISQFVAGDVRLTSSADKAQRAEQLWRELAADNADLVRTEGFIFGRVM